MNEAGRSPAHSALPHSGEAHSNLLPPEFLAEIRRLQLQMRRISQESIAGQYRSAFRGSGMEFEEVREYFPGDEIRRIDWKVTARHGKAYVKSYREERELHVLIAVDVSPSTWTGTRSSLRREVLLKTTAALASIAAMNGDKVGFLTFSDSVIRYQKPQKSRNAMWKMLHEIAGDEGAARNRAAQTNLEEALRFLGGVLKRRSVVFLLSDFFASGFEKRLGSLAKRHDVTAVPVRDPADDELPDAGYVRLVDPESGETLLVDCSHPKLRERFRKAAAEENKRLHDLFNRSGVDSLDLKTNEPLIRELVRYFQRRIVKGRHRLALRLERSHGR